MAVSSVPNRHMAAYSTLPAIAGAYDSACAERGVVVNCGTRGHGIHLDTSSGPEKYWRFESSETPSELLLNSYFAHFQARADIVSNHSHA
jgi:hypothetical protein